ncbi:protein of unknown function [Lachnospiraceae bacterium XBB1006]|nr:protein of unknown function [Lachnospiraceae bacterium XBB1006]
MHEFLKSVGFSKIKNREDVEALMQEVAENPSNTVQWTKKDGTVFTEISHEYAEGMGIAIRGEYNLRGEFIPEYYFPYFCGTGITTHDHIDVERHSNQESYAGVCDEARIGVTLIFYLQNALEFFKDYDLGKPATQMKTALAGLAKQGMVLLPVKKDAENKAAKKKHRDRLSLLEAAKEGDEEAIESLTLEDIDTYSMLSKRIIHEDVLTIVNTYFMPYGIESDQYAILGEIVDFHYVQNAHTKENICVMRINCNSLMFDICINQENLLGEPQVGRRIKAVIWMQGSVFRL